MEITIPDWVSIKNYRTMTTEKKNTCSEWVQIISI